MWRASRRKGLVVGDVGEAVARSVTHATSGSLPTLSVAPVIRELDERRESRVARALAETESIKAQFVIALKQLEVIKAGKAVMEERHVRMLANLDEYVVEISSERHSGDCHPRQEDVAIQALSSEEGPLRGASSVVGVGESESGGHDSLSSDDEGATDVGSEIEEVAVENDSVESNGQSKKPRRNRPSGLRYKLRAAVARRDIAKHIKGRLCQLESFFGNLCGDEWEANGAAHENSGSTLAHSGVHVADKANLVGKDGTMCDVNTPRFVIGALLAQYLELFNAIVANLVGIMLRVEVKVRNAVREHFKLQAIQVYSDCGLTLRGYQRLANLLFYAWDPKTESILQVGLPNGANMVKLPSKWWSFHKIAEEMNMLGLKMTGDKLANSIDVQAALRDRIKLLVSRGMIDVETTKLRVQLFADTASCHYGIVVAL
jgi:hypothetical protein